MQVEFYKRTPPKEITDILYNLGPANKLIENLKETHPNLRVKENSNLYKSAVFEYNKKVIASKTRPAPPDWFCGKTNPDGTLDYKFDVNYVYNLTDFNNDWYVVTAAVLDNEGNVVNRV